ncbi:hypothetical protein K431DRAFT_106361 [Polychaeton citri CBS 116435]|uniref:Uncharacterized protein n=1 Tax=Polychaeton citri CBS 116435 TaxID=1314669 RepID=A0A9P4Q7T8_9PEZI|nr:hypothetical protein K431DRAFT_106361 [Polychaeton citri CBS 116435]
MMMGASRRRFPSVSLARYQNMIPVARDFHLYLLMDCRRQMDAAPRFRGRCKHPTIASSLIRHDPRTGSRGSSRCVVWAERPLLERLCNEPKSERAHRRASPMTATDRTGPWGGGVFAAVRCAVLGRAGLYCVRGRDVLRANPPSHRPRCTRSHVSKFSHQSPPWPRWTPPFSRFALSRLQRDRDVPALSQLKFRQTALCHDEQCGRFCCSSRHSLLAEAPCAGGAGCFCYYRRQAEVVHVT